MCDYKPVVLRPNRGSAPLGRRSGPSLRSLVVDLPEVWFLLRLLPGSLVIIPGVPAPDSHARIDLAVERLQGVVSAPAVRVLRLLGCFAICVAQLFGYNSF